MPGTAPPRRARAAPRSSRPWKRPGTRSPRNGSEPSSARGPSAEPSSPALPSGSPACRRRGGDPRGRRGRAVGGHVPSLSMGMAVRRPTPSPSGGSGTGSARRGRRRPSRPKTGPQATASGSRSRAPALTRSTFAVPVDGAEARLRVPARERPRPAPDRPLLSSHPRSGHPDDPGAARGGRGSSTGSLARDAGADRLPPDVAVDHRRLSAISRRGLDPRSPRVPVPGEATGTAPSAPARRGPPGRA